MTPTELLHSIHSRLFYLKAVMGNIKGGKTKVAVKKAASSAGAGTKAKTTCNGNSGKKSSKQGDPASFDKTHKEKILEVMLRPYQFGKAKPLSTQQLAKLCKTHERTKSFLEALKALKAANHVEKGDGGYILTETGASEAGYVKKEFDSSQFSTNSEWLEYIQSTLNPKWKGGEILELLSQKVSLSRKELAAQVGVNDRSHSFSYGLKEVREHGFVELVPGQDKSSKKLRLSAAAFVEKDDSSDDPKLKSSAETGSGTETFELDDADIETLHL
jgi:hypothetical protein